MGDEIILKLIGHKSGKSSSAAFTYGAIENGLEINNLLARITSCDSAVWLKKIPNKLNLFNESISFWVEGYSSAPCSIFGSISPLAKYNSDSANLESIEYGSKIIYDHLQLFANNQFKLLACQDTVDFKLAGPRWMEQWELQNQPSFISLQTDSNVLEEFVIIHGVIPQKRKEIPQETLDTIQWEEIEGGLFMNLQEEGKGKALRNNHWAKIDYEVLNADGEVIYANDEPFYFYIGSNDVPIGWNKALLNAKVGTALFIKASPYWGHGLDGLFPIIPAMNWYYYKIELLGAE